MPSRCKAIETTKHFSFKMKAELKKDILCFWVNAHDICCISSVILPIS